MRRLRGFLPVGGALLVTPQDLPEVVAGPGDGESAGGGLPRRVQGLLPGSMVSSESEWTAESSSESSAVVKKPGRLMCFQCLVCALGIEIFFVFFITSKCADTRLTSLGVLVYP